jgi:hypothetical protein
VKGRGSFQPLHVTRLLVKFRSQGVQWPLRANDGIEVETADLSVGALSGEAIRHLIQHYLATAALQAYVVEDLREQVTHEAPVPVLALRKGPIPMETRAQLRAERRTRRKA